MTLPNESKRIVGGDRAGFRRAQRANSIFEKWSGILTGGADKASGGECRARLGRQAVKRSQCPTWTEADGEQAVPQWPHWLLG